MCNLYSLTKGRLAIREFTRAMRHGTGNLPSLPSLPPVFPDYLAPVVHTAGDGECELVTIRWGMPGPTAFGEQPITKIRNTKSPHGQRRRSNGSVAGAPTTNT